MSISKVFKYYFVNIVNITIYLLIFLNFSVLLINFLLNIYS